MAKKTNRGQEHRPYERAVKKSDVFPMSAVRLFLAACVAELWLVVIQRFFINGNIDQFLAFADILKYSGIAGAVIFAVGAVLTVLWRKDRKKREAALWVAGIGAFLGITGLMCYKYMENGTKILLLAIPAMAALLLAYLLYQRDFFWSVSVLALGILDLWAFGRTGNVGPGNVVWLATICVMVLLVAVLVLFRKAEQNKGVLGGVRLMPVGGSYPLVYGSCALVVVTLAVALVVGAWARYLIWLLAIVVFAMTVYYTMKEL